MIVGIEIRSVLCLWYVLVVVLCWDTCWVFGLRCSAGWCLLFICFFALLLLIGVFGLTVLLLVGFVCCWYCVCIICWLCSFVYWF